MKYYKILESHYIMNFAFLFIRLKYFYNLPTIQAAIIKHGKQGIYELSFCRGIRSNSW